MLTLFTLIKERKISCIFHALLRNIVSVFNLFYAQLYYFRATWEDIRLGGKCTNKIVSTKYKDQGAHSLQNSDYRCLDRIFKEVPLRKNDVFMDVGCGEGRILTYLYLRGFQGKMYGVEIDPDFAETASRRTQKCQNVEIINGDVLNQENIIRNTTAFFLFNPFSRIVLNNFLDMIEKNGKNNIRIYYLCDYYRDEIEKRDKWEIVWRGMIVRKPMGELPATVYEL